MKRLQQNRVSALKCRRKKKDLFENLVRERDVLKQQNQSMMKTIEDFQHQLDIYKQQQCELLSKLNSYENGYLPKNPTQHFTPNAGIGVDEHKDVYSTCTSSPAEPRPRNFELNKPMPYYPNNSMGNQKGKSLATLFIKF